MRNIYQTNITCQEHKSVKSKKITHSSSAVHNNNNNIERPKLLPRSKNRIRTEYQETTFKYNWLNSGRPVEKVTIILSLRGSCMANKYWIEISIIRVSGNIGKLSKIQETKMGNPERGISYDEISRYLSEPSPLLLYHRAP